MYIWTFLLIVSKLFPNCVCHEVLYYRFIFYIIDYKFVFHDIDLQYKLGYSYSCLYAKIMCLLWSFTII